jgi:hypothetical protein
MAMGVVSQFVAQNHGEFIVGAAEIEQLTREQNPARG